LLPKKSRGGNYGIAPDLSTLIIAQKHLLFGVAASPTEKLPRLNIVFMPPLANYLLKYDFRRPIK
jgi:hypothetical protein